MSSVSEHALVKLGYKTIVSVASIAVAFMFLQIWDGQADLKATVIEVGKSVAVIATEVKNNTSDIESNSENIQYIQRSLWTRDVE